jgi:hypothetical protein
VPSLFLPKVIGFFPPQGYGLGFTLKGAASSVSLPFNFGSSIFSGFGGGDMISSSCARITSGGGEGVVSESLHSNSVDDESMT